jgi:formylmethanofuran--tetrahydromethanopterin N-formyltransferase
MSQIGTESGSTANESKLEVIGYDDKDSLGPAFIVKSPMGHILKIRDTFAEMFPMWVGRILITADSEKWAMTAAQVATGLATSVIMSPAEAGIEGTTSADETPDHRAGVFVQVYNRNRFDLRNQLILRIGQCVMTCPTTSAFDALLTAKRKMKIGRSLRLFGDGFQKERFVGNRKVWKIPVMEGEFIVEHTFGVAEAIAGGNFLILAKDKPSGLKAAEEAVSAIKAKVREVVLPFPGGVCRSGSKAGSLKYKLKASTNHPYCPQLRTLVPDSQVPEGVNCIYEIVVDGLTLEAVRDAMREGIKAAITVPGVTGISAGNYGGRLGPYKAPLKELLGLA